MPAHASEALEAAMRDAVPHLFEHTPDLLYQLVTMVSPRELRVRSRIRWRRLALTDKLVHTRRACAAPAAQGCGDWVMSCELQSL